MRTAGFCGAAAAAMPMGMGRVAEGSLEAADFVIGLRAALTRIEPRPVTGRSME